MQVSRWSSVSGNFLTCNIDVLLIHSSARTVAVFRSHYIAYIRILGRLATGGYHSTALTLNMTIVSASVLQVVALRQELTKMQAIAERAQGTWDKFRKERDFHRMHHKRVVQVCSNNCAGCMSTVPHCHYQATLLPYWAGLACLPAKMWPCPAVPETTTRYRE